LKKLDLSLLQYRADDAANLGSIFEDLSFELKGHNSLGSDALEISKLSKSLAARIDNLIFMARTEGLFDEKKQRAVNSHRDNLVKKEK
jgi:hypothetical protein